METGPDEFLVAVFLSEQRHEIDAAAQLSREIGGRDGAAAEDLAIPVFRRNDVLFGRFSERLDVDVFVDDGVSDDETAHALDGGNLLDEVRRRDPGPQILEKYRGVFRIELQRPVGEIGRAEGDVFGVQHLAAELLDRQSFGFDAARDVAFLVAVFRTLQVEVRPHRLDDVLGPWIGRDTDVIDAFESGDHLGAQLLGEDRPVGSLVDEFVGRQGDDQNIAMLFADIEMALVPDMQDVEHAMRQHDLPPGGPGFRRNLSQLPDCLDFFEHRFTVPRSLLFNSGIIASLTAKICEPVLGCLRDGLRCPDGRLTPIIYGFEHILHALLDRNA